ncbi:hypothetical protein [Rugamonas aquatica]|uniref:DUF1845 domain-containing protein n=1 Tax=Rugamonas aquatica TaxID=2743357 RepID=A0A6A7N6M7_9BURK|nr:hypothetical protein [Rugamonas aquatica]MQA40639.1 hypothetical protein [Rugamonas aquatica]
MDASYVANADLERINARLIERYGQVDLSGIESASRSIPTKLYSPDAKRLFVRYFHLLQMNMQYISVIGRLYLEDAVVTDAEERLAALIQAATDRVNKAIKQSEQTFRENGVTNLGSFHIAPISADVLVFSSFARRYLELITKLDHLMLMLEIMAIDEFISITAKQQQKSPHKRAIRAIGRESLSQRIRFYKMITAARGVQSSEARGRARSRQRDEEAAPAHGENEAAATGDGDEGRVGAAESGDRDSGAAAHDEDAIQKPRAPRRRTRNIKEPGHAPAEEVAIEQPEHGDAPPAPPMHLTDGVILADPQADSPNPPETGRHLAPPQDLSESAEAAFDAV